MRIGLVAGVLVLVSGAAHAEDDVAAFNETHFVDTTFWPDRSWEWAGHVAADTGTRVGTGLTIGGEVGVTGAPCEIVATGGEASLRDGPANASLSHWARLCLTAWNLVDSEEGIDVVVLPIELEHELEWNVLPALSSRRIVWSQPFTRERIGGTLTLARIPTLDWLIVAMPIRQHVEWLRQSADGHTRTSARFFGVAGLLQIADPSGDGSVTIFEGGFEGDMMRIDLVRFDRFPIRRTPLRFDLALGSKDVVEYVDGEFVRTGDATGMLGLWVDAGSFTAGVRASRDYYETLDDAVAKETRVDAEMRWESERRSARLTGFAARTSLLFTDGSGEIDYDPTFGVEAKITVPIGEHLEGSVSAGWARSFYSEIGDMQPTPTPAFELNAQIVARFGRY